MTKCKCKCKVVWSYLHLSLLSSASQLGSFLFCVCHSSCLSFQVNLFFLLNIVRVLITKLKVTHHAESSLYMKAVRATLILVPLLGIQYVLLPYKPGGRVSSEIYDYIMHILMHYQVSSQISLHVILQIHSGPNINILPHLPMPKISFESCKIYIVYGSFLNIQ